MLTKAGILDVTTEEMETHYFGKWKFTNVIKALIVADKANLQLTFKQATAIDLAGRDVLQAVSGFRNALYDCGAGYHWCFSRWNSVSS